MKYKGKRKEKNEANPVQDEDGISSSNLDALKNQG